MGLSPGFLGLVTAVAVLLLAFFPASVEATPSGAVRERRSTSSGVILDYDTLIAFLEYHGADERLLKRLVTSIEDVDYRVKTIAQIISSLPRQLTQQLSAARIIDIENNLRNELEEYQVIVKQIRSLHENRSRYDNQTFLARAGNIQEALDNVRSRVKDDFPNQLRTLDRNLRGGTVTGSGSTEGLLCDASVNALEALKTSRNLTSSIRDGPVAMLDGLISLQELAIELYATTCDVNDPVCRAKEPQFRQFPQRQRDRLAECIPPWVISLAKDDVVAGRLQVAPFNKALTLVAVHFQDNDVTNHFPELHDRQEGAQQLVVLERLRGYYRLVIGESCYVTLHNQKEFRCSFPNTNQDALFAVETSRGGDTWVYNVQTQRYLVAGESRERCRENSLAFSLQRGAPWTFDSSFSSDSGSGEIRQCAPTTVAKTAKPVNGADPMLPGVTSLVLSLLTAVFLAVRPAF